MENNKLAIFNQQSNECKKLSAEFMEYRFVIKRLVTDKPEVINFEGISMVDLLNDGSRWAESKKNVLFYADEDEIDNKLLLLNQALHQLMVILGDELLEAKDNPVLQNKLEQKYREEFEMERVFKGIGVLWKLNYFKGGLTLGR